MKIYCDAEPCGGEVTTPGEALCDDCLEAVRKTGEGRGDLEASASHAGAQRKPPKYGKRSMAISIARYGRINALPDEWLVATLKVALEGEHAGWLSWLKREQHWGIPIAYDPDPEDVS